MFDKGRHNAHTRAHQQARWHLRQGIATCALKTKVDGELEVDCVGRPLQFSNEMAERHSIKTLQKWADGRRTVALSEGMDFCARCQRVPRACRCRRRGA